MTLRKMRGMIAVLILGSPAIFSGCAHKPCPIIPAQLELAEARLETVRNEQDTTGDDIARLQQNVERLQKSISDLEEEKALLEQLISGSEEEEE
ncbi:MAG: hypothetical protein KJ970_02200 [Candidatus Eisenbacteria bacterium]|uniref:Uncharacterized protein n=1 Tax=Eiseniibacteriota bacterium TaxID=2212470 RepID=A0A948W4U4_UNCEI|nr:hypothetical protein [Candidatus Eisenbacteria bacterium]MBU1950807.1 hypothetical protein [Candidatus Eisenbacteria bacterium]MBU2689709.1 hypothetical protein [Candidatus Eisenbacteria bacterium]